MIESIKELRARTNLGMTACKKALEQAGGDIEAAIELLQKQGLKKVDDLVIPLEGAVHASPAPNFLVEGAPQKCRIFELNCQTDFGARSEIFQKALEDISGSIYTPVEDIVKTISQQLGEKVVLRRLLTITMPFESGFICTYNHHSGNIAVVLGVFVSGSFSRENRNKIYSLANDVAMHIAAMKPLGLKRESINVELVEKKRAIFMDEAKDKKPEMQAKIVDGKMNKWFAEVVLLEQESIVHTKKIIGTLVDELKKEVGDFSLGNFVRWERGEQL